MQLIIIRIYIYELYISPELQYIRGIAAKVRRICTNYTKKQLCSDKVCEYFILHYTQKMCIIICADIKGNIKKKG